MRRYTCPYPLLRQKWWQSPGTLRMELSWRVFLVSYPSNRQQRTVEPEPANSARFKSVKPSWEGGKKLWEAAGRKATGQQMQQRVNLGRAGRAGSHHSPTDCCITRTQGQDPGQQHQRGRARSSHEAQSTLCVQSQGALWPVCLR